MAYTVQYAGEVRTLFPALALLAACSEDLFYHDSRCANSDECDMNEQLVRWQFETFAGEAVPCPAGADVIEIILKNGSAELARQRLACSAHETWFYDLWVGPSSYEATVTSADGTPYATLVHAPPLSPRAGLPGTLLVLLVDGGYLQLEWTFANECQKPREVVMTATPIAGGEPIEARRECSLGYGSRIPLPAGEYDVTLTGTDTLGSLGAPSQRATIEAPNKLSAPIEFQLTR